MVKKADQNFQQSSLREKIVEHQFVSDLLKKLWLKGTYDVEIARPEVDNSGVDLIVTQNKLFRHIQLKSSFHGAATTRQKVNIGLGEKLSGCVIWIQFDPGTLDPKTYLWFGIGPGDPLPDMENFPKAKHTKANMQKEKAIRPNIRIVNKGKFTRIPTIDGVIEKLFGT